MTATSARPCHYCHAAYPTLGAEDCTYEHRDDPRVYDLARALARMIHQRDPTDEEVAWFLHDADCVVDDFDPVPERWHVRRLPETDYDEFDARFRINDVTYVAPAGDKERSDLVRLSTYRQWQREANVAGGALPIGEPT